jgi:selenide, water dikinase
MGDGPSPAGERRLTSFSHGAGCGCKLGPDQLREVMGSLRLPDVPPEVMVGLDTGDDATVWQLDDDRALVATLDFFTPIVDDPYDWGRIAATNAMSDVYAMGGTPFLALNIVAWPVDDLPLGMLASVLQGGVEAASKAGVAVLGGHSITDPEPKYGMVALGFVHPDRMVSNAGAEPGDTLFLTKPLGLGMISTAVKRGVATDEQLRVAVETMTTSNADAAAAMIEAGAHAATDVTGFGLLGHLQKLLAASGVGATIHASAVPLLPGVLELAQTDVVAGGTKRNHASVNPLTDWGDCTLPEQLVLADAQTSGGLLVATPDPDRMRSCLRDHGVSSAEIGTIVESLTDRISVSDRLPDPAGNIRPR